jgi:hypothetical protein
MAALGGGRYAVESQAEVERLELRNIGVRNPKFDLPKFPKQTIIGYLEDLGRLDFGLRTPIFLSS